MDAPVRFLPHILSLQPVPKTFTNDILFSPEISGEEEKHRQLPPDENVPQGRGAAEEGRRAGLNAVLIFAWTIWHLTVVWNHFTMFIGSFGGFRRHLVRPSTNPPRSSSLSGTAAVRSNLAVLQESLWELVLCASIQYIPTWNMGFPLEKN